MSLLIIISFVAFSLLFINKLRLNIMSYNLNSENEEAVSDDEIFFGKLSLKEFKKHILWNGIRQNKYPDSNSCKSDANENLNILESHSQPNLLQNKENKPEFSSVPGSPAIEDRTSDESFVRMENMVSNLCLSPRTSDNIGLNNTLEVIEYILNNGPKQKDIVKTEPVKIEKNDLAIIDSKLERVEKATPKVILKTEPMKTVEENIFLNYQVEKESKEKPASPKEAKVLTNIKSDIEGSPKYFTPIKVEKKPNVLCTPVPSSTSKTNSKTPIFKTPANPVSNKKTVSSVKKTPNRNNAYQHITSPIASYIKQCPQVPLVKDVLPKKPLPGPSSIPKFVIKHTQNNNKNKENINLPSVAYKSAKKTKVINLPDEQKLPQCQWVKKITSTLPRPTVMKHENREMNSLKKSLHFQNEDSFANLSSYQAEVSVCTQKTAFKSNKNM